MQVFWLTNNKFVSRKKYKSIISIKKRKKKKRKKNKHILHSAHLFNNCSLLKWMFDSDVTRFCISAIPKPLVLRVCNYLWTYTFFAPLPYGFLSIFPTLQPFDDRHIIHTNYSHLPKNINDPKPSPIPTPHHIHFIWPRVSDFKPSLFFFFFFLKQLNKSAWGIPQQAINSSFSKWSRS